MKRFSFLRPSVVERWASAKFRRSPVGCVKYLSLMPVFGAILFSSTSYAEMPNAYHSNQIASGAIATGMDACTQAALRRDPNVPSGLIRRYCSCTIDWIAQNSGLSNEVQVPPPSTVSMCASRAKKLDPAYPLKNSFDSRRLAADSVWEFMNRCQEHSRQYFAQSKSAQVPPNFGLYYCSCVGDFFRDHVESAAGEAPGEANHYCVQWALKKTSTI